MNTLVMAKFLIKIKSAKITWSSENESRNPLINVSILFNSFYKESEMIMFQFQNSF